MKRTILYTIPYVMGFLGLILIILGTTQNSDENIRIEELTQENNAYHRTVACILSVPLDARTPEYIEHCYKHAEDRHDIKLERFNK